MNLRISPIWQFCKDTAQPRREANLGTAWLVQLAEAHVAAAARLVPMRIGGRCHLSESSGVGLWLAATPVDMTARLAWGSNCWGLNPKGDSKWCSPNCRSGS